LVFSLERAGSAKLPFRLDFTGKMPFAAAPLEAFPIPTASRAKRLETLSLREFAQRFATAAPTVGQ